ncbi:hypothetical protein BDV12DRAFT_182338 [Aspergillus spectabilis]
MSLEAFEYQNATALDTSVTHAIPGGQQQGDITGFRERSLTEGAGPNVIPSTMRLLTQSSRTAVSELMSLFPKQEAAALLDEFRRCWKDLYCSSNSQPRPRPQDSGFISVFLMVIAIGLQYAGPRRRRLLATHDVDVERLSERIFSAIQARLLEILSFGSLEAVQSWPVCGCGLRIAQALKLHRKLPRVDTSSSHSADWRKQYEKRKRCWWAIYEIETFCSMSYGYPHSIKDTDCDVEPLDPSAKLQFALSPKSFDEPLICGATLFSMETLPPNNSTTSLHRLVDKVAELDTKLQQWHAEIPPELDFDIGASGPRFENHIFQLQALALKLAYDNARILVHRPLLSYKLVSNPSDPRAKPSRVSLSLDQGQLDPFRLSLQACREAALSTSEVVLMPIAELVSSTYAAAFVGIRTFTAGITLGILSSLEPLSQDSHVAKSGLPRLISVQTRLKSRYLVAAQSLEILQRLTKHVMEKELAAILDVEKPARPPTPITDADTTAIEAVDTVRYSQLSSLLFSILQESAGQPSFGHPAHSPGPETISNLIDLSGDLSFEGAEDPALSQAVYDFDRGILNQPPPFQEGTPISSSLSWPPAEDFQPMSKPGYGG